MGNISDHVKLCNEECAVRASEAVRHGQIHMEKVMDEDRRRRIHGRSRDGSKGPHTSREGRESARASARSSARTQRSKASDDNPMREYRPAEASAPSHRTRSKWDAPGAGSSTDAYVPPASGDVAQSFDPWAPEGVYARRQREKNAKVKHRKSARDTEASRNADEGPRNEDTQIGASISEFLRRGVAQAAPKPAVERPEMMPSKDGGFIATIQQGFQGIFGHLATSKEEVLKMRGPMSAVEYEAVPGDDLDQQVQSLARQIPEHLGEWLKIYRKARGEYEVSGEVVRMAWQSTVGPPTAEMPQGQIHREVFVFVESADAENDVPGEPLHLYLRHSANVAYDLHFGSAMMKVPEQNRLSFTEETGTLLKDSDADSKYKAMLLASEQALKRERAAISFRKKMDDEAARPASPPKDKGKIEMDTPVAKDLTSRSSMRNSFDDLLAYLPPLPPLLPPALPGPGGSFLLPPGSGLDFLQGVQQPPLTPFMQPGPTLLQSAGPNLLQSHPFKPPGSSTTGNPSTGLGVAPTFPAGSFYNAGLGPHGGSFLGVGGSFLMTNGMQTSWGNLPRTGSNVQVGMPFSPLVG